MGWRTITALAAVAILAGCVVGPDFVPPNPPLPETSFTNDARDKQMPLPTDPLWWASFRDPILTSLANRVAASNLDVQTATVRLAESRFQRGITAAALFPSVNGSAKYTRELYSKNGILSLLSNLLTPAQKAAFKLEPINEYNVGLDASWSSISGAACAGRSNPPMPRSTRVRSSNAQHWSQALRKSRGITSSFAVSRPRSGSPMKT